MGLKPSSESINRVQDRTTHADVWDLVEVGEFPELSLTDAKCLGRFLRAKRQRDDTGRAYLLRVRTTLLGE